MDLLREPRSPPTLLRDRRRLSSPHEIQFYLTNGMADELVGCGGAHAEEVAQTTGTIIESDRGRGMCSIKVRGPLLWCYLAHATLMKKYHEVAKRKEKAEANAATGAAARTAQRGRGGSGGGHSRAMDAHVDMLEERVADLVRQLEEHQSSGKASSKSGMSGRDRARR